MKYIYKKDIHIEGYIYTEQYLYIEGHIYMERNISWQDIQINDQIYRKTYI